MSMLEFDLTCALDRFSLEVEGAIESGITGLFGPSGSGKTTLLHALAGLRPVDRGTIRLGGRTLLDTTRGFDLPPEERRVGVVFQDGRLFPHLDVAANLRFGMPRRGEREAPAFDEVVELLALNPLLKRAPARLSGGERQRVALGRALLAGPRVLLLDEPLASLDRPRRTAILPYLRRLPERFGIPVVHVTHDLAELLALTDRMLLLSRGRIVARGSYRALAMTEAWNEFEGGGEAEGSGRTNVLTGTIVAVEGSLCQVQLDGENAIETPERERVRVAAIATGRAVGERVIVTIGAEEIALALATGEGGTIGETSIQNQLAASVERRHDHAGRSAIELRVGPGLRLLVEITSASAERLGLRIGRRVTALVKASAIRVAGA